ncbi:MAG: acetyl-CoA hydrolase/transferase family protein [Bacteroidota bacterium]
MTKLAYTSPAEAFKLISHGARIYIHGSAATPTYLVEQMALHHLMFQQSEIVCISVFGNFPIAQEEFSDNFKINALFVSAPIREQIKTGNGDYVPVFLSEIPELFKRRVLPIDVAIIHVSPPDENGYVSLGTSVDAARTAVEVAKVVIAQVNPLMPRTHGDTLIHASSIHAAIWHEGPLHEVNYSKEISQVEIQIGKHVAGLIENGSTLQMGIGCIPDAVLSQLTNHKHLSVHTEMLSDGILQLIDCGAVDNSLKTEHRGKSVTSFCAGTSKLYGRIHNNPDFAFLDVDYVNEPYIIRKNPKVVAINSCIEMDLTGQVCSDSIGTYQYSGVGGQMDFMRGAAMSDGGKPIIAFPSRTGKGVPRIVPVLKPGAGVVTTRAHVHWVVTEYGTINLFGMSLKKRARELIKLAHPDDRTELEKAFYERFKHE